MSTCLVWFRRDLRLADNPALQAALEHGHRPLPVYLHDDPDPDWPLGAASAWWLHHSLLQLRDALRALGSDLLIVAGEAAERLPRLVTATGAKAVYWNRCYEPAAIRRDKAVKERLRRDGVEACSFNAGLVREPWQHLKKDGTPYRVFTPFWKSLLQAGPTGTLAPPPDALPPPPKKRPKGVTLESLKLLPAIDWDRAFYEHWQPGEDGAHAVLESFSAERLPDYPQARDLPAHSGTSRLSPHLHFGEISPLRIWDRLSGEAAMAVRQGSVAASEAFLRQVGWREFGHHLLYHFPKTPLEPLDPRFGKFPWRKGDYSDLLRAWQRGRTGIPIVDAGMRELWTTGYMHNRVRMLVASFLTKNLLIPWQEGARWFWDTLLDADLANNTLGWQWTAGCGADAAPYFRIFNPVLQGEKFDADGDYVRRWVPELTGLDKRYIHKPWAAEPAVLAAAGIEPGVDYPPPLVDLKDSRREALAAWDAVKRRAG